MSTQDPELWFHERAALYVEAQLLYHLNDVGVFGVLASGERVSTQEIATRLGLVESILQAILDYIHGIDDLLDCDVEGRWGLTAFGVAILERFGRESPGGATFNLFDVRVGAYGPVWDRAGDLLQGKVEYGAGLLRRGDSAAKGVYTVGAQMAGSLETMLSELSVDSVVEWGVTTGLLQTLSTMGSRVGVDRNDGALRDAERRAAEAGSGEISWVQADVFELDQWRSEVPSTGRTAFFTVHFHEFMALGEDRLVTLLRALSETHAGSYVLAMEQPRLSTAEQARIPRAHWLYAQANLLIHHLIGNGRILEDGEWRALFERGGCRCVRVESMEYLGYQLYVFELGAHP